MEKRKTTKESAELLKKLADTKISIKAEDNKDFSIPKLGSLGLLALGYKGLVAWRKVRQESK